MLKQSTNLLRHPHANARSNGYLSLETSLIESAFDQQLLKQMPGKRSNAGFGASEGDLLKCATKLLLGTRYG